MSVFKIYWILSGVLVLLSIILHKAGFLGVLAVISVWFWFFVFMNWLFEGFIRAVTNTVKDEWNKDE
jgi:hypothetical protein